MIDQKAWAVVKLAFLLADTCVSVSHAIGWVPAWIRRNSSRFITLLFGVAVFVENNYKRTHAFVFLVGLIIWNWPKDDEPPRRRRRRKQERKEEHSPPNWSGVPENA